MRCLRLLQRMVDLKAKPVSELAMSRNEPSKRTHSAQVYTFFPRIPLRCVPISQSPHRNRISRSSISCAVVVPGSIPRLSNIAVTTSSPLHENSNKVWSFDLMWHICVQARLHPHSETTGGRSTYPPLRHCMQTKTHFAKFSSSNESFARTLEPRPMAR